jgi:competence protein ComEC
MAAMLLLPFPALGGVLLDASRWAADILWQFLEALAGLELTLRPAAAVPELAQVAACVGALLLIAPRGFPGRLLGLVWLLPLLLEVVPRPQHGDYRLTLLDVGQGLAAVVQTRFHVLVYDAGPSYRAGFDAGRDVVVPYLRSQGLGRVDRLMVSHENSDHAGGAAALWTGIPTADIVTNASAWRSQAKPCRAGARWHWDGVDFEILHPASGDDTRGNDGSCVLKVSGPGGRVLLPGDVEKRAEAAMVSRSRARLRAEVLVVPHHGSSSSSSAPFLDAVRPEMAIFPVGYRNRYRFPHAQVLRRLSERSVQIFDTARHGAITLEVDGERGIQMPRLERIASSRIWRARE